MIHVQVVMVLVWYTRCFEGLILSETATTGNAAGLMVGGGAVE